MEVPTISREELESSLDDGQTILVEALSERAYEDAHLPGAINIPLKRIDELAPDRLPDKDAPIVVYCSSPTCRTSTLAGAKLLDLGYRNVRDFEGGKQEWAQAGLPFEGDSVSKEGTE